MSNSREGQTVHASDRDRQGAGIARQYYDRGWKVEKEEGDPAGIDWIAPNS
jgi:hypothetical protein